MATSDILTELAEMPNVVGTLVTTHNGDIVTSMGELEENKDSRLLLGLLRDVNGLLTKNHEMNATLNRLTINVGNVELQTTLDEQHIYLVKKHYNA